MKTTSRKELERRPLLLTHDRVLMDDEIHVTASLKVCVLTTQDLFHLVNGEPIVFFDMDRTFIIAGKVP